MSSPGIRTGALASTRGERIRADLILLAVAVVWGSGFVGGRVAGAHLGPLTYNGARFLLGALTLLPLAGPRLRELTRAEIGGGLVAGLVLVAAANLQQIGLQFTTAGKAGFITGLYVVLVPLLAALFWRRPPSWMAWAASLLATAGLFLLSGATTLSLAPGDGWVLSGAFCWAVHILLIGTLALRTDPIRLAAVQFTVCGLLSTLLGLWLDPHPYTGWEVAWWAVVYNGVLAAGLGLTLQTVGQRHAPPTDTAVILSLESVFAALFGWLLLHESLSGLQLAGCGLMLAGMVFAQVRVLRRRSTKPASPGGATAEA